jgi:hypothetical protein
MAALLVADGGFKEGEQGGCEAGGMHGFIEVLCPVWMLPRYCESRS